MPVEGDGFVDSLAGFAAGLIGGDQARLARGLFVVKLFLGECDASGQQQEDGNATANWHANELNTAIRRIQPLVGFSRRGQSQSTATS